MEKHYYAVIEQIPGTDIGIWFPDFPGCVSAGASHAEALLNAREALQLHIDGMLEDGETVPEPAAFENLPADSGNLVLALVSAHLPSRRRRINITIDEGLLARIEAKSNNVSGFLAEAAREKLATGNLRDR